MQYIGVYIPQRLYALLAHSLLLHTGWGKRLNNELVASSLSQLCRHCLRIVVLRCQLCSDLGENATASCSQTASEVPRKSLGLVWEGFCCLFNMC